MTGTSHLPGVIALVIVFAYGSRSELNQHKTATRPEDYCSKTVCDHHSVCRIVDSKPECLCEFECEPANPNEAVCGSDGVTYGNRCVKKMKECFTKTTITIKHEGRCGILNSNILTRELKNTSCGELPPPPENAKFEVTSSGGYKVVCNEGYYRLGIPFLQCNETGNFKVFAKCHKKACGFPERLMNGRVIGNLFHFEATTSHECDECFYLDGPKERKCLANESWSGITPKCRPIDCGNVTVDWEHENAFVFGQDTFCGSKIEFHCFEGYELVGNHSIVCQPNGKWSDKPPKCQRKESTKVLTPSKRQCSGIKNPDNGYIENIIPGEEYDAGHFLQFGCNEQYEINGEARLRCMENGSWSHPPPSCNLAFCKLEEMPSPEGGYVTGGNRIWQVRMFSCEKDRLQIGPSLIYCKMNGKWSGKPPICKSYCDDVTCESGKKCVYDTTIKDTRCICIEKEDCSPTLDPICGSDGNTYNNACLLKSAMCLTKKRIEVVENGLCIPVIDFKESVPQTGQGESTFVKSLVMTKPQANKMRITCPPCDSGYICKYINSSDFALIGKKVVENEKMLTMNIKDILKGSLVLVNGRTVNILKSPKYNGCLCNTESIKGSMIITGRYKIMKDGSSQLTMTSDDYIGKYYGSKQIRCARDLADEE